MKHLLTFAALVLCTNVMAQSVISNGTSSTIISRDGSTVSSTTSSGGAGSVILDNQSSVTSSVTTDSTGVTTNSITGRTGSMCSATHDGRRCEISCQAPQVAQCTEKPRGPACFCR
jgi:hypothetical protein